MPSDHGLAERTAEAFVAAMRLRARPDREWNCGNCPIVHFCAGTSICDIVAKAADAFGVPQPPDGPRDYLAALPADQD